MNEKATTLGPLKLGAWPADYRRYMISGMCAIEERTIHELAGFASDEPSPVEITIHVSVDRPSHPHIEIAPYELGHFFAWRDVGSNDWRGGYRLDSLFRYVIAELEPRAEFAMWIEY